MKYKKFVTRFVKMATTYLIHLQSLLKVFLELVYFTQL